MNASYWNIFDRHDCAELVSHINSSSSGHYFAERLALAKDSKIVVWSRINDTGWFVITVVPYAEFVSASEHGKKVTIGVISTGVFVLVVSGTMLMLFLRVKHQYGQLSSKISALEQEIQSAEMKAERKKSVDYDVLKGGSERLLGILRALVGMSSGQEPGEWNDIQSTSGIFRHHWGDV
ncbi:hypothetical protein Pelo_19554 [Pelomyxa schiedti]|nr:hypothetical protein Pelo_19554 [Pelomyxa schiedti]